MDSKINISDLFLGLQDQMKVQLNTNREIIKHPVSKGDALENVWIEWLKKYLPNRYCVDKAIIIDSEGNLSHQIDLVIYDQQYTPFVFTQNGIHYIPAEGVYAVFEIKPDLEGSVNGMSYIEYAGKKIESVRKLKRTSTKIIDRGESKPARTLTKIIGGILTSVNSYAKEETIVSQLKKLNGLMTLEMGCVVEGGCFYIDYDGDEDSEEIDFNKRIQKYYSERKFKSFQMSDQNKSLVAFFLQLSRYLQQTIGTVAAIDFTAYATSVGVKIDELL